jgi:Preprotein translocase subunit SecD
MKLINLKKVVFVLLFTLLAAPFSYGQGKEKKINNIIDQLDFRNKTDLTERLEYLNSRAKEEDSVSLTEVENLLANRELREVIVQNFDEYFTDKEINELHKIMNSDVFQKLSNSSLFNSYSKLYMIINDQLDLIENSITSRRIFDSTPKIELTLIPVEREDGFYASIDYDSNNGEQELVLEATPSITKKDILEVKKEIDNYEHPYISVTLNEEGTNKFHLLTQENVGKPIAIVIDKHIVMSPTVQMPISGGKVQISGNFSEEDIDRMINILKDKTN